MTEFLIALVLAAVSSLGAVLGGVLSLAIPISRDTLGVILHGAVGIVLAVIGVELMPQALATRAPWIPIVAFVAGGAFFILLDEATDFIGERISGAATVTGSWGLYAGVVIDLLSDGIMIGAGTTVSLGLGLLLAVAQVPANLPEGFVTIAAFQQRGVSLRQRAVLAVLLAVPIVLGAIVGYWGVRGQPHLVKLGLLAFTAGVLIAVVVEEMVPEAHRTRDARLSALALVVGFALFALLASYVE